MSVVFVYAVNVLTGEEIVFFIRLDYGINWNDRLRAANAVGGWPMRTALCKVYKVE